MMPSFTWLSFFFWECNIIVYRDACLFYLSRKDDIDTFIIIIKQEPSSKNKIQIISRNWTCSSLHST